MEGLKRETVYSAGDKIQKFTKNQTSKFGIDLPCRKPPLRLYMEWEPIVLSMLQHCAETCHFLMDLEEKLPLCFFFLFGSLEETPILQRLFRIGSIEVYSGAEIESGIFGQNSLGINY